MLISEMNRKISEGQRKISDAHRRTLNFIRHYIEANGYAPKLVEIASGIGIRSRGVVHRYIQALADAGYLKAQPGRHRGIYLTETDPLCAIPFMGKIAAGRPIEAIAQEQTLDLSLLIATKNLYALRVQGDSMIDEGILDGDVVICEARNTANNGEIVVALIDQQEATLKRLRRNADETITLIPSNPVLHAVTYASQRVEVQGIYVGLVRLNKR